MQQTESTALLQFILNNRERDLKLMADAWLAMGADAFMIRCGDATLYTCGDVLALRKMHQVALPLLNCEHAILCVYGLDDDWVQLRLEADARLILQTFQLEKDIEDITDELVSYQDQLLAMYNLTQSVRAQLDLRETLQALVHAIARLMNTEINFIIVAVPNELPIIEQNTRQLHSDVVYQLFAELQMNDQRMLFDAMEQHNYLPAVVKNVLCIPIKVREQIIAAIGFMNHPDGFASPQLKLANAIADEVGAKIENVLLHQESVQRATLNTEMDLARRVQSKLLPKRAPQITGIDVYGTSKAARQVGGDFYDFIINDESDYQSLLFAVGDVTGKGVPAAMVMAMTRTALRSAANMTISANPQWIVQQMNEDVYDDFTEIGVFTTLFVGQYLPQEQAIRFANAGHSPVLYYAAETKQAELLMADGTAIGILPESLSQTQTLHMNTGDILFVATDGFSEASNMNGEMFGYDRLLQFIQTHAHLGAEEITHALLRMIDHFASDHEQEDDQTIIVIKQT